MRPVQQRHLVVSTPKLLLTALFWDLEKITFKREGCLNSPWHRSACRGLEWPASFLFPGMIRTHRELWLSLHFLS